MRYVGLIVCGALALALARPAPAFPPAPVTLKDQKIVFSSVDVEGKKVAVGIMNGDGSKRTLLTKGDALALDPALSPDGKRVAFVVANEAEKKGSLWVMNADGTGRKKLLDAPEKSIPLTPAWSPDGKRIAYAQLKPDAGPSADVSLLAIDADGKNAKTLGKGLMPSFSPDGKKILFTVFTTGEDFEPRLHVMDADGKNAKELLKGRAMMGSWSPDGKSVAYLGAEAGPKAKPHVWTCKADGSGATQLTRGDAAEVSVLWAADGKHLFFNRMKTDGPPKNSPMWVMDADGKNPKEVTKGDGLELLGGSVMFLVLRGAASGG